MSAIQYAILAIVMVWLSGGYMWIRNNWVFRERTRIMNEQGSAEYRRLPRYDKMLWGNLFNWDVEKMKKKLGT